MVSVQPKCLRIDMARSCSIVEAIAAASLPRSANNRTDPVLQLLAAHTQGWQIKRDISINRYIAEYISICSIYREKYIDIFDISEEIYSRLFFPK